LRPVKTTSSLAPAVKFTPLKTSRPPRSTARLSPLSRINDLSQDAIAQQKAEAVAIGSSDVLFV
jgi:hypothetical protein